MIRTDNRREYRKPPKAGKLFVFEGADGAGKTTICRLVTDRLVNLDLPFDYMSFPGNEPGTLGAHVYSIHHSPHKFGITKIDPEALQTLHVAAHLDLIANRILPTLRNGRNVILDRYWWSTYVYGTIEGADQKTLEAMIKLELIKWGDVQPETIFLILRSVSLTHEKEMRRQDALTVQYRHLADMQRINDDINIIENDGELDEVVNKVFSTIRLRLSGAAYKTTRGKELKPNGGLSNAVQIDVFEPRQGRLFSGGAPAFFSSISPVRPTEVFHTYWRFAAERQEIFFRKIQRLPFPWTNDPILAKYKFTNAYRASDRVSQHLIKHVIYEGDSSADELFFRIILFKVFNKIETWTLLKSKLGSIAYSDYSFARYDSILARAMTEGTRIYSAAYIMASGRSAFGHLRKHSNHLRLIEKMMEDEIPKRIADMPSMQRVFELLRSYPMIGDFLAYQFAIDLNYSALTNFSEMEFVVPGPGALDGIRKCFSDLGGLNEVDVIRLMADRQEKEFEQLSLTFKSLWGRGLQLVDCQNLFCEVDKYARIAHPRIRGISGRTRIKQAYRPNSQEIEFWYPPKWGINELIRKRGPT